MQGFYHQIGRYNSHRLAKITQDGKTPDNATKQMVDYPFPGDPFHDQMKELSFRTQFKKYHNLYAPLATTNLSGGHMLIASRTLPARPSGPAPG